MSLIVIILLIVLVVMLWKELHRSRALIARLRAYIASSRRVPTAPAGLVGPGIPAEDAAAVLIGLSPEAE